MKIKWRVAIWGGEACLTTIALLALFNNYPELAGTATVGIVALLPKLVESEEKTNGD